MHGRLVVETPDESPVLDIEPTDGDITVDGRLTIQGETELDGTTINASATVNGAALLEAALRVDNSVAIARDGHVGERIVEQRNDCGCKSHGRRACISGLRSRK